MHAENPETPSPDREAFEELLDESADAGEKANQSVTVEDIGPARKKLTIEIPEERIAGLVADQYEKLKSDAVIPGFRRGRAPQRLVERRFGEAVKEDVRTQLISDAFTQAVEDNDLDMVGYPDLKEVDELKLPDEGPLTFEVEIEVAPEVELPDYASLEVERPAIEVGDAEVDAELERLSKMRGQMQSTTEGTIEADDFLKADVRVVAGQGEDARSESAMELTHQPEAYIWVAGESREYKGHVAGIVIPDLGKRLIGQTMPGVTLELEVTGPSGHEDERIRDQPVTIFVNVNTLERIEPASPEQLATDLGLESPEALREGLKERLEAQRDRKQRDAMRQSLSNQLAETVELELPEGLTSRQTDRVLRRQAMELAYQGVPEPEIEQRVAELRAGSEEEAKRELKLYFILSRAAKDLEIDVSESEVNTQIAAIAMQQGRRPERLRQELAQNGMIEQLYTQVRDNKVLDRMLELTTVRDVEATDQGEADKGESDTAAGG